MVKQTSGNARIGHGKPGPGRPKGSQNKLTRSAREAFLYAFEAIGGMDALAKWAKANPAEFYRLYGRLIPTEQNITAAVAETRYTLYVPQKGKPRA